MTNTEFSIKSVMVEEVSNFDFNLLTIKELDAISQIYVSNKRVASKIKKSMNKIFSENRKRYLAELKQYR